jgi:hypothetical protein
MKLIDTDIDIDFADRDKALEGLHHVPAMLINKVGQSMRHPSGVYFQNVPVNPVTGYCAFPYGQAAEHGYIKVDLLNVSLYEGVRDEAHLDDLISREPDWSLLEFPDVVERLAHINGNKAVVDLIRPRSIEDLAIVLALIRPGKAHLRHRSRAEIEAQIWEPEADGYRFKRAHAIAYAASIAVQLNLVTDAMLAEMEAEEQGDGVTF